MTAVPTTSTSPRLVAEARAERLRANGRVEDAKLLEALLRLLDERDQEISSLQFTLNATIQFAGATAYPWLTERKDWMLSQ